MITILSNCCPKCGEDELWHPPGQNIAKCKECGWDSGELTLHPGETMAERWERAIVEQKILDAARTTAR